MRFFILLAFIITSTFVNAQATACGQNCQFKNGVCANNEAALKQNNLEVGQEIKLYPIPVADGMLHIEAIELDIYGLTVYNAGADIVEIENLSGRGNPTLISVTGLVTGIYYIKFDTSEGMVVKRFSVL
jgi:hypothetical protein